MEKPLSEPKNHDELIKLIDELNLVETRFKLDRKEALRKREVLLNIINNSKVYADFNRDYLVEMFRTFHERIEEISEDVAAVIIKNDTIEINYTNGEKYVQNFIPVDEILIKYTKIPNDLIDIAIFTMSKDIYIATAQYHEALSSSKKNRQK